MKNNLGWIKTKSGGSEPVVVLEEDVVAKIGHRIAYGGLREFFQNQEKCVIPEYNSVQSEPLVRVRENVGYDTAFGCLLAVVSGWHFIKPYLRPLYYANSEGMQLIAKYGCPHKAYASLEH